MKKIKNIVDQNSEDQPNIEIHERLPRQSPSSRQNSGSRVKLFFFVSAALFLLFIAFESVLHIKAKDAGPSAKRNVAIQLEVLNGTGEAKIAQRVTNVLRSGGFDVVDMGNYKVQNVERTLVIARTADVNPAASVASFLGVGETRVLHQPDKNLYLDVSVVIGKDINQLRAMK